MASLLVDRSSHKSKNAKQQFICSDCVQWDYSKLFSGVVYDAETTGPLQGSKRKERFIVTSDVWDIRTFGQILSAAKTCSICNFVLNIIEKRAQTTPSLQQPRDVDILDVKIRYRKHSLSPFLVTLRIDFAPPEGTLPDESREPSLEDEKEIWLILPAGKAQMTGKSDDDMSKYAGRDLKPYCDFTLVNLWLDSCANGLLHATCQKGRFDIVQGISTLRFIDIANKCIASTELPQRYAALSYVWGAGSLPQMKLTKENFSQLTKHQALFEMWSEVPTTIKDAIQVCENCNIPFLWVDALCIIQDGPVLLEELAQMTEIYSMAYVTIIAAHGDNSWSGLKGVSSPRVFQQEKVQVGDVSLIEGLPSFAVELHESSWPHRAWTLQEHLFSRRCLMFLENRVLFQCDLEWLDESIISQGLVRLQKLKAPSTAPRIRLYDNFDYQENNGAGSLLFPSFHNSLKPEKTQKYLDFVETYFRLNLTYDSDIMNACQGTLKWFQMSKKISNFWALPTVELVFGLSFLLDGCIRREGMPSWSWVGWRKGAEKDVAKPIDFHFRNSKSRSIRDTTEYYIFELSTMGKSPALRPIHSATGQGNWYSLTGIDLRMAASKAKDLPDFVLDKTLVCKSSTYIIKLDKIEKHLNESNRAAMTSEIESCSLANIAVPVFELVEIGSIWDENFVKGGWQELVVDAIVCLLVKTNSTGMSERVGVQVIKVQAWKKIKSHKKWVYLV